MCQHSRILFELEFFGYERGSFTGAHTRGKMGLVEIAEHGTLFLDEVGDIPITCQSKILRFLDDGSYLKVGATQPRTANVNIISSSNRDLSQMVKEEAFRADLQFRLKTVEVNPASARTAAVSEGTHTRVSRVPQKGTWVQSSNESALRGLPAELRLPGRHTRAGEYLQHMTVVCDDTMDLDHLPE